MLKEENIIKDVRNLFKLEKLKKEANDTTVKSIRNLFRLEKENEEIKDRIPRDKDKIIRDIRNLFDHEAEESYHKPVRVAKFWSNNCIEHKSEGDKNKTLSIGEYLNKITPYLKIIINNFKKS